MNWVYYALDMANRHHQPKAMRYNRESYHEDPRFKYMMMFLDVRDMDVLELGPLEGQHSIMLEKMGAKSIMAVEARDDNLEKCRHVKDLYHLDRTHFVKGNVEEMAEFGDFDLVFCMGILYHLIDPMNALMKFAQCAPRLFLGTHFSDTCETTINGYQGKWHKENGTLVCGMSDKSFWPDKPSLIRMLGDVGYKKIDVLGDYDVISGCPHITIMAET